MTDNEKLAQIRERLTKEISQISDTLHDSQRWFDEGYREDFDGKLLSEILVEKIIAVFADRDAVQVAEIERLNRDTYETRCSHCGWIDMQPRSAEEAKASCLQHIADCAKHPIRVKEAEIDRLRKSYDCAASCILDANQQLEAMTVEIERLKTRLLSAAGDDLCRLSQEEIKAYTSGMVQIPPKEEFLSSCERFHQQITDEAGVLTNCLTLAQLIAENAEIELCRRNAEQENAAFRERVKELEEALTPFADHGSVLSDGPALDIDDSEPIGSEKWHGPSVGNCRRAAAVLAKAVTHTTTAEFGPHEFVNGVCVRCGCDIVRHPSQDPCPQNRRVSVEGGAK